MPEYEEQLRAREDEVVNIATAEDPGVDPDQQPAADSGEEATEQPLEEGQQVEDGLEVAEVDQEPEVAFSWQASEYVHHHKTAGWYAALGAVIAVLIVFAILFQLWLYIGVFLAMGGALVVYARKPPRTMLYELSTEGINIDGKIFPFADFRSFGVLPDDEWHSIDLEPAKSFRPRIMMLFDPEDMDEIVGHLELHLPRADRQLDVIERITKLLRF